MTVPQTVYMRNLADNQLYGYAMATKGVPLEELIESMNLTSQEWQKIKRTTCSSSVKELNVEIENYFKKKVAKE